MIKLKEILNENGSLSSNVDDTILFLNNQKDKRVLFITTSTRYPYNTKYDKGGVDDELPKSTELALYIQKNIQNESVHLDIPQLKIVPCEGNVSHKTGNSCGIKAALLKDKEKNPSGNHRCWASLNDKTDQLWKVSNELFKSDIIIFFASIRWGQANAEYQKLIERLTWIENRHNTLGEKNVIDGKQTGFICIGQNWNGMNVVGIQKKVLDFYGFGTPPQLFWNWQYTKNTTDETKASYKKAYSKFQSDSGIPSDFQKDLLK